MRAATPGPTDWSDWEKYREQVVHPTGLIKPADLERATRNIESYAWAKSYADSVRKSGDAILAKVSPDYLSTMIEWTTPGCMGPCPACRAKGLPWHPNGQWSWSGANPNQLTCKVCQTVFPDAEFPEEVVVESKWGRGQKLTFMGGDTFKCFGYTRARPSISGITRSRKISAITSELTTLSLAYVLTHDPRYAHGAKAVLLRFAEVFPEYLVYAGYGYGEYAGMDPHVAAEHINDLPEDELVYPPNKPDRKISTGCWPASRIGSSGMDGGWVVSVATAYDLTCTAVENGIPVYSADERRRIEHDVLLESTYLAVCDPAINNKSVGNRTGAAVVGMIVGHPGLVRFGLDGFKRTVEEWFLPDGGTSESPAYAMMTMHGIKPFALAFRRYADPAGYTAPDGTRLDDFDACRDTRYGDCWQDLVWSLQGNLRFPPSADSYRTTGIDVSFAELLAVAYPTNDYVALLKEIADTPSGGAARDAVFYREPGFEAHTVPPLAFSDVVFPFLSQGGLRTGATGRDSLLLLNASDWGGHHHYDSLDLYYWKDGKELLSDLGYLWDHPDKIKTYRTFAHNLVMLDGREQVSKGRSGRFHLFSVLPRVKVMEADSDAYGTDRVYRRTCAVVDHGGAGSYVLDLFRVSGSGVRDYVFHGPNNDWTTDGLNLTPASEQGKPVRFALRFHLAELGEVLVDDVEICEVRSDGTPGPNLAPNPSVIRQGDEAKPRGWGCYIGDGAADWGFGQGGHADASSAWLRSTKPDGTSGRVNVALLCGESDGYRGVNAIEGRRGTKYKVRFSIRGAAKSVNLGCVTWPADPTNPGDRHDAAVTVAGGQAVEAGPEWQSYEGSFVLSEDSMSLANVRTAPGTNPWRVAWSFADGYTFEAFAPGSAGETVRVGDGWGQRDHTNTDVGAVLPYLIRRVDNATGITTFVSVFVGNRKGQQLVQGVRLVPLPPGTPDGAVAVAVQTATGLDILISLMQASTAPVVLATDIGQVATDARFAAVLTEGEGLAAAALVAGTRLAALGTELQLPAATVGGRILGVGSARGTSYFDVEPGPLAGMTVTGQTLFAIEGSTSRGYAIRGIQPAPEGNALRVFVKGDSRGFEARSADRWELPVTAGWEKQK